MEKYNASKIKDNIVSNQVGYYEENGYTIGISSFIDGVNIEFIKDGNIVLLFQTYDLRPSIKEDGKLLEDKRPEFIRINYYKNNEIIPYNLLVDFDLGHNPKKIHLNFDYISKNNLKDDDIYSLYKGLDHFEVEYNVIENEKSIIVNFEETLISLLKHLNKSNFYSNFDEIIVGKIYPSNDEYINRINEEIKEIQKSNNY